MTKSSAKPAKSTQRYRNTPTHTHTSRHWKVYRLTPTHTHIGRQKKLNLLGEFYLVNNLGKNSKWLKLASHII